jgi:hypothetical protein
MNLITAWRYDVSKLDDIWTELEDAMYCQWGDDPKQNVAAKGRATKAKQEVKDLMLQTMREADYDPVKFAEKVEAL